MSCSSGDPLRAVFTGIAMLTALLALQLRPYDHWVSLLASGVLAFVPGLLILAQWSTAATWIIGLLVGIDLLFAGLASVFMALSIRSLDTDRI